LQHYPSIHSAGDTKPKQATKQQTSIEAVTTNKKVNVF
jgi:hypothetical protein